MPIPHVISASGDADGSRTGVSNGVGLLLARVALHRILSVVTDGDPCSDRARLGMFRQGNGRHI